MSTFNINLSGKIASPVAGSYYGLKSSTDTFFIGSYKAGGYYSEDSPGANTVTYVDITTDLAAISNPKDGDTITITGVSWVLKTPLNRGIVYSGSLVKWHCGTT